MTQPLTHKLLNEGKYGEAEGLRPNTMLHRWVINFIFNNGGLGDFVNYAAATIWIAKNVPWVEGRVYTPRYLTPLMQDIHKTFPTWKCLESETAHITLEHRTSLLGDSLVINGQNQLKQLLTCLGAHPIDVAFAYYASTTPAPKDCVLPILDYDFNLLPKILMDKSYVVFPVGHTVEARKTTGKELNPIIEYVVSKGLTPVFLGKKDLLMDGKVSTNFAKDISYELGIDMRDQTDIKQAACIMQHARATVGLDCGLLHLAALMKDSRIVFGYNITTVEHREPRRNHGETVNVFITEDELKCIACQSKLKHIAKHKFNECLYGDTKCIDLLFKNNSERWVFALKTLGV
jgi:hypothetical protein